MGRTMTETSAPDYGLLTPKLHGAEVVEIDESKFSFTAFSGSGWDSQSEKYLSHDGLRYAIAIQQFRDAKDYVRADEARRMATAIGYDVGTAANRTTVLGSSIRSF